MTAVFDMPDRPGTSSEGRALVNKGELAQRLKCSVPTVTALLTRYPNLPVVQAGTNGRPWLFDFAAVAGFIADRRAEERIATEQRDDLLDQLTLPLNDTPLAPTSGGGMTPAQLKAYEQYVAQKRKNDQEAGLLVPAPRVQAALATSFDQLGRFLDDLPRELGRKFGLAPDVVAALATALDGERSRFVTELTKALTPPRDDAPRTLV